MTKIGVPKEIKNHEYRVGLSPSSARELIEHGHSVFIEKNAGAGVGFTDEHYAKLGVKILNTAQEIFDTAELIVKVKEPQPIEYPMLKAHHTLFTFLHLAPDPEQTAALVASGAAAIAYETVTDNAGGLPLLAPMSEVAGRMSIQVGAQMLEKGHGGSGVLLGGVAGVKPASVVVLGGGVVGANAARIAQGMGADVVIFDKNTRRLNELDWQFKSTVKTLYANTDTIEEYVHNADLVIGAVLIAGAAAPRLVTRAMLKDMRKGSVLVDVAIDQGGCFETSKPTTHDKPSYEVDGIIHYCVTNMPGAVARTSTVALNNVTLSFALQLANKGTHRALLENTHLLNGLNVYKGQVTCKPVAEDLGYAFISPTELLAD